MGLPVEVNNLMLGSLGGYTVGRSLRFRSSASAYLNRTPSSTGNRQKFTWSGWVKRGLLTTGTYYQLFGAGPTSGGNEGLFFDTTSGGLYFTPDASTAIVTSSVYRDPSAWYHIVLSVDTTQATSANREIIYVNGVQVTSYTGTYCAQNTNFNYINVASAQHRIGAHLSSGYYFDGYMAEVNFIDGQALTPSSFGAYDTNGVWQPKKYSGTYGTNGFYLPFSNTTSTTTLVQDSSGNGNNWTPNNISLTAGTTYDSMIDSPTVSASSSNYCVLSPINITSGYLVTDGNLNANSNTAAWRGAGGSVGMSSGKWYWELAISGGSNLWCRAGIANVNLTNYNVGGTFPDLNELWVYNNTNGQKYNGTGGAGSAYGATWTTNDVIGVAFDADAGTLTFYKNNATQGTAFTGLTSGPYFPALLFNNTTGWINFGQRPFSYTPPSGYKALNTYNLPTPTIKNGAQYMAATLYTGNGTSQSISNAVNGVSFQPDFVWYKDRSVARDHALFNVISGATYLMSSNNTSAESAVSGTLTSFNSNGYSIGSAANANANGETYVGWQWKAGGTAVTNNSGTISSQVSANTSAGISITTYTGTGANATVGHGLGVAPSMIITKSRSLGTENWNTFHTSLAAGNVVQLNTTIASTAATTMFTTTLPTSSVFSVGTNTGTNGSGSTYVAYCFSAVAGYSAFGKYTGNGSTDGPFTYLGFRPRFIMIKRTDTTMNWYIFDTSRDTYNVEKARLFPNLSDAESTNADFADYLSNGFKLRSSDISWNASGGTYIYAAFAEHPFQASRAR